MSALLPPRAFGEDGPARIFNLRVGYDLLFGSTFAPSSIRWGIAFLNRAIVAKTAPSPNTASHTPKKPDVDVTESDFRNAVMRKSECPDISTVGASGNTPRYRTTTVRPRSSGNMKPGSNWIPYENSPLLVTVTTSSGFRGGFVSLMNVSFFAAFFAAAGLLLP